MNRSARIVCLGIAVLAAGLYLVTAGGVRANAAGKKDLPVTDCLQKGDEANEFSITGEDGKSYDLTSSSVELSKHVGRKVTVTGTFKACLLYTSDAADE